ncbi:MAG: alanine--glyoxylate aminotransferase family protein [Anaerolineales bacterium]|nr:alanine--glyoxylate aminotransferase family protein [Anaerolineales bacterium]
MSPMFVPGPVDVAPEVLEQQTKPMLPHRSKDFEEIFRRAADKARQVFFTEHRIFIMTNSGSGAQEACVRNLAKERVLSCINGAFSKRWYTVAQANGKQADMLEVPMGQAILPGMVEEALQKQKYELITVVHNETSTGVMNPIKEIAEVVHRVSPDTLIAVDAVSSLAGAKVEMDAWGIDVLFTSSQKALALPPGLALCAVNERGMARAAEVPNRGWYFDFLLLEKHRNKDSTPMTPGMSLVFALDYQLDRILAEGIENRFARHAAMAKRSQEWAVAKGWPLFAAEGYRSHTLTVVSNPPEFDCVEFNKFLAAHKMRLANGYGDLKGKTFRIAHMGEIQLSDVDKLLALIDEFMVGK